jgi:thiol-disulfide isomerase/thioredoxin
MNVPAGCGHCKKAKPEFTSAAEHFKDDPKVEFAAVDCTQYMTICEGAAVKGYPTIKYFHYYSKETRGYNGARLVSVSHRHRNAETILVSEPE